MKQATTQPDIIEFLQEKYPAYCLEKEICEAYKLSQSAVSEQMQRLISHGRVRKERQGFRLIPSKEEELPIVARALRKLGWSVLPKELDRIRTQMIFRLGMIIALIIPIFALYVLHYLGLISLLAFYAVGGTILAIILLIVALIYFRPGTASSSSIAES